MQLGGVKISNRLAKNIAAISISFAVVVSLLTSLSTAVLGLTAFYSGVAIFSFVLELCPNHELPNFVAYLKPPKLHPELVPSPVKNEPWKNIAIPKEIDEALSELYERILLEYVYSWYGQISYDEEFILEVRTSLKYATAVLLRRLGKLNLSTLITQRGIPIGLTHLDSYLHAKKYSDSFNTPVRDAYYDFVGAHVHPATHSREKEVLYVHDITRKLLPFLTTKNTLNCLSLKAFLNDLLAGAVLQPVLDILADPDIINYILQIAFNEIPAKVFKDPSGDMVELLESFTNMSLQQLPAAPKSALQLDLSAILKNQQALFAFMQFLKAEGAINQLQFCLSIEDFNKRIMNPELSNVELVSLHKEAMELYEMYFKSNAVHKVNVKEELVNEIVSILNGPPTDVVKLRTRTPLFGAYEEVYNNLESMCPAFHKSEQYFLFLLGRRVADTPDSMGKHESKGYNSSLGRVKAIHGMSMSTENLYSRQNSSVDRDGRMLRKSMSVMPASPSPQKSAKKNKKEKKFKHKKTLMRSRSDFGAKTTEKIGKGMKTLKQGVMVKSMEGIADPLDPAYDLADMCETEGDEKMSNCSASFSEILEYRDLSAWRVSIPELKASLDSNRKAYFVFVVEVQRIDVSTKTGTGDDLHWTVERRYPEFYNLEQKLTEFHGEFEDAKLPPKAKLFSGRGLDVMQAKKQPFEDYLKCLLQKPSLKGSDILFTFLTSSEEFTPAATSHLKMIKNVPMKLTKERGQGLQPFIATFVASTISGPSKPRSHSVVAHTDYDMNSERQIPTHPVFQDNLGLRQPTGSGIPLGHCNAFYAGMQETSTTGIFDTIIYLAVNVFKVTKWRFQLLSALRILLKNTVDAFVDYAIAAGLKTVLSIRRVAYICSLIEEAVFEPSEARTDEDKLARRRLALSNTKCFLRPLIGAAIGSDADFDRGVELIFNALQDPVINKHLTFVLFDAAVAELFPELTEEGAA